MVLEFEVEMKKDKDRKCTSVRYKRIKATKYTGNNKKENQSKQKIYLHFRQTCFNLIVTAFVVFIPGLINYDAASGT